MTSVADPVLRHYFSPDEISIPARHAQQAKDPDSDPDHVDTPEETDLMAPNEGSGVVRLFISAQGTVDRVEIIEQDFSDDFLASFKRQLFQSLFSPAQIGETPVASWQIFEFFGMPR